ncbi:D-hexose-6-phosphate mutarotase [Orbus sturtevantii]|uniref:D-hexose-6-phosphate mutarotase n=1 Tax=Orbus sturtevantii TaxID=3074109 RepID=UPI00370D3B77
MSIIQIIKNTHDHQETITKSVYQTNYGEHTLLVISHPECCAAISLQGAHLLYWHPKQSSRPIIWLSEKTIFKKGTAIRGGIPVCWPWFGKVAEPAHGFARIVDWQLTSCTENEHGVDILLSLKDNERTRRYWPHSFELELKLHLGKTCQLELAYQGDFNATGALHSYFGISDISAITVSGLGDTYEERLTTRNEPKIVGQMTFDQAVDRIYTHPASISLIKDKDHTIKITHHNHSDVVTWTPWDGAKNVIDLDDESYHHFVCVETSRINKPIASNSKQKTRYGVTIEVVK